MQVGQAPCGELNENMRGASSGSETPCSGQAKLLGVQRASGRRPRAISTRPSAERSAVSIESVSRLPQVGLDHEPVDDTAMSCLSFLSSAGTSSSRYDLAVDRTRVKPSPRSLSSTSRMLALAPAHDRRVDGEARALGQRQHLVDDLLGRLAGDRPPADRAVRAPDARVQQAQVVVDLGDRADRRARVARRRLLVDRDRRREPLDRVDVGLLHLPEELARVGRQRLDVAALALGVERVERERRLARAREPGDARRACRAGAGR